MEKSDYKICSSCQTQNNPAFLFCWKCGKAFDGATVVVPTLLNTKGQNVSLAIFNWILSGVWVLLAFQGYRTGQKWISHLFSASLWFTAGFIQLFINKLSKKSKWVVASISLLFFGGVLAWLSYKKLI